MSHRRPLFPAFDCGLASAKGKSSVAVSSDFTLLGPGRCPPARRSVWRGVARDGARLAHPFEVVHCTPEGDGWLLQVRATDAVADLREAFGR